MLRANEAPKHTQYTQCANNIPGPDVKSQKVVLGEKGQEERAND